MDNFFEFAYLDERKISQYLAQRDRGSIKRRVIRETTTSTRDAKGGVAIPWLGEAGGGFGKSTGYENEIDIESTPEGEFARLHSLISDQANFPTWTEETFSLDRLAPRSLYAIEGLIQVLPTRQGIAQAFDLGSLYSKFVGADPQTDEIISKMGYLFQTEKIPITINDKEGKPIVYSALYGRSLSIPLEEIEEAYTLLGKIVSIIGPHDPPYSILKEIYNPTLLRRMPPLMQRELLRKMAEAAGPQTGDTDGPIDFVLSGPLVILSPIAIYR